MSGGPSLGEVKVAPALSSRHAARIGVVDDHPTIILGVGTILAGCDDLDLVASGRTVRELLAITTDLDVVLLDLRVDDCSTPTQNVRRLAEIGRAHV